MLSILAEHKINNLPISTSKLCAIAERYTSCSQLEGNILFLLLGRSLGRVSCWQLIILLEWRLTGKERERTDSGRTSLHKLDQKKYTAVWGENLAKQFAVSNRNEIRLGLGWEFAHQFFKHITRFLWAKERKVKINYFFNITSFLALKKKSKNTFPPVAGFKKVFLKKIGWFCVNSPNFQRPCDQGKRQH